MEKRIGTFYGVSVGPGDPELMTLQAVRRLENCPVIAAPQTPKGGMLALDIAKGAVELSGKTILPLRFAMSLDPAVQKAAHIEAARAVKEYLDAGQDVAMLNLGDVSVYATFGYLQEILEAEGEAQAQELTKLRTELLQRDLKDAAVKKLTDEGFPVGLADLLTYTDKESMEKSLQQTQEVFKSALEAAVKERLRGKTPEGLGGGAKAENTVKDQIAQGIRGGMM